ncbi:hypothetical protein ACN38_g12384 [Penicillium nordicum]|uniref:Uncharacterized protein n=1 Tax=Penicillium nordicum TaxID=229535 RepID=A0A0M8NXB4_9EURO|nr:hypothetical protein ACN38_g12384 [Penicillium nordicum]
MANKTAPTVNRFGKVAFVGDRDPTWLQYGGITLWDSSMLLDGEEKERRRERETIYCVPSEALGLRHLGTQHLVTVGTYTPLPIDKVTK